MLLFTRGGRHQLIGFSNQADRFRYRHRQLPDKEAQHRIGEELNDQHRAEGAQRDDDQVDAVEPNLMLKADNNAAIGAGTPANSRRNHHDSDSERHVR